MESNRIFKYNLTLLIRNVSNEHKWMKQNGSCCTPIMVAALKGDMESVVILLQADADVTIKSS